MSDEELFWCTGCDTKLSFSESFHRPGIVLCMHCDDDFIPCSDCSNYSWRSIEGDEYTCESCSSRDWDEERAELSEYMV